MKRLLLLLFIMLPIYVFAQTHITFAGVPLARSADQVESDLVKKGFVKKRESTYDGVPFMEFEGKFWKFFDATVKAVIIDNNVLEINVSPKDLYSYDLLHNLINSLDEKYGKHIIDSRHDVTFYRWDVNGGIVEIADQSHNITLSYLDYSCPSVIWEKQRNSDL